MEAFAEPSVGMAGLLSSGGSVHHSTPPAGLPYGASTKRTGRLHRAAGLALLAVLALVGSLATPSPPQAQAVAASTAGAAASGTTRGSASPSTQGKIQPELRRKLAANEPADFWVRLRTQPSLTAATKVRDWTARGDAVVSTLRTNARSSQTRATATLRAAHARFTSLWIDNTIYVHDGDRALAEQLADDPQVAAIRSPRTVTLPKPLPAQRTAQVDSLEWGLAAIHADQVWSEYATTGQGIVVGSIDSGAQYDHPALVRSYRGTTSDGSFHHDHNWYDPAEVCGDAESVPCDNNGHGTHTIGTMVGDDGAANKIGVAPGARWIAAKGCETSSCSDLSIGLAAQWMLAPTARDGSDPDPSKRPNILNNSWSSAPGDTWFQPYVRQWVAAGIFPTFALGNRGPACGTQNAPGELPESYAVGAVDSAGTVAPFSSRGSAEAPESKPDIAAPGVSVRSSYPGNRYSFGSGTSMAAPHVSGAVALLWSAAPSLVGDVAATRALLDETAHDHADDTCGGTADDNHVYGEGMLDVYAAVVAAPRAGTGELTGTVTATDTGKPLEGAKVSVTGTHPRTTTTGPDGRYHFFLDQGAYDVEVRRFGYDTHTLPTVPVRADESTTRDVALVTTARSTLTAQVSDGSGHGWPVYASVTIEDVPGRWFTSPDDGRFSVDLPVGATYRVTVTPLYPGYRSLTREIRVEDDTSEELRVEVDVAACVAPGYATSDAGVCGKVEGGLVHGQVTDANTDAAVEGAAVTRADEPRDKGTSATTPDDPALGDGFFWLFSSSVGAHPFTARMHQYQATDQRIDVRADAATRADFALGAGALTMTPGKVLGQVELGRSLTRTVRLTNTGTAPVTYGFAESQQGFTIQPESGTAKLDPPTAETAGTAGGTESAPPRTAPGAGRLRVASSDISPARVVRRAPGAGATRAVRPATVPAVPTAPAAAEVADGPWRGIADYPTPIRDNATAYDQGLVYSFGGTISGAGATPDSYVYDPSAGAWRQIADMPEARQKSASGFVDGTFYVVGGWGPDDLPSATTLLYDPATDRWRTGADNPHPWAASGSAVLDGRIYSVGGCVGDCQSATDEVTAYDVATNRFSTLAPYPEPISWPSCGGIDGKVYCAGGLAAGPDSSVRAYAYDPKANSWTRVADLPLDLWGSSYAVANGQLVVSGGAAKSSTVLTNEAFAYHPERDVWTALPNSGNAVYRGAATCGFYKIGGHGEPRLVAASETLAGYDDCERSGTAAPWLRETPAGGTLAPKASVTVTLTLDSRTVAQPGTYRARVSVRENTPYAGPSAAVTFTALAPPSWARLSGYVRGTSCAGTTEPLPGATVAIDRGPDSWTLTTARDGGYVLWAPGNGRLARIVASSPGYGPAAREVKLNHRTVRSDLRLQQLGC